MKTFADYVLEEKNIVSKIEIIYYLSKKTGIYFEKPVLFKTEIARQFIEYAKLDVDANLVLTSCLLCNCKKVKDAQTLNKLHSYAVDGATYLSELGFEKRFCKICEEVNRYSESRPREKESDILELADNFGGMLLNRPERIGMNTDEAVVLLEHRNLKNVYNRYLDTFIEYINEMQKIKLPGETNTTSFKKLVKIYNEAPDIKDFVKKVVYEYTPILNKQIKQQKIGIGAFKANTYNSNRSLFSEETTRKILNQVDKENEITR